MFLQMAGIPIAMLGILQAIPRTPLYERIEKAGRLRSAAQGNNTLSVTNIEPLKMSYEELVGGYRDLFLRAYTWDAIGERWLNNVKQWGSKRDVPTVPGKKDTDKNPVDDPHRKWIQKPLGRPRLHLIFATLLIFKYYFAGGKEKRNFALKMIRARRT